MHDDIVLKHDEEHRWCLDCHDATDRDWLHLASGERVAFDESYRLCGQCHGEKLRDWRAGVHGRRTGEWNGHKHYLLCAHCHNPHAPRFKAARAEAAADPAHADRGAPDEEPPREERAGRGVRQRLLAPAVRIRRGGGRRRLAPHRLRPASACARCRRIGCAGPSTRWSASTRPSRAGP